MSASTVGDAGSSAGKFPQVPFLLFASLRSLQEASTAVRRRRNVNIMRPLGTTILHWLGPRFESEMETLVFTKRTHRFLYGGVWVLTWTGRASYVPRSRAKSSSPDPPARDRRNIINPLFFVFALTPQKDRNPRRFILLTVNQDA